MIHTMCTQQYLLVLEYKIDIFSTVHAFSILFLLHLNTQLYIWATTAGSTGAEVDIETTNCRKRTSRNRMKKPSTYR